MTNSEHNTLNGNKQQYLEVINTHAFFFQLNSVTLRFDSFCTNTTSE